MAGPINISSERMKHTLHDSYQSCFKSYKWDSMWQLSVKFRRMLSGFEGLCNMKLLCMNVNSCSFYLKVSTEHFPFRKQQDNARIFPRLTKLFVCFTIMYIHNIVWNIAMFSEIWITVLLPSKVLVLSWISIEKSQFIIQDYFRKLKSFVDYIFVPA